MKMKRIAITLFSLLLLTISLSACGSGSESDSIDTQMVTMSDGCEAVVITNQSEDQTLSVVQVKFDAYDDEGNTIENEMFHPRAAVVSIAPGESAVGVNMFDPEDWEEKPARMDYTIEKARFGKSTRHIAVTDTSENYYQNYNVILKNDGEEDIDLQEDYEESPFYFYAIFRDDEGKVTGVSTAFIEDFEEHGYPAIAVGEEINTSAYVGDIYPGTCQIVLTRLGVMTQ